MLHLAWVLLSSPVYGRRVASEGVELAFGGSDHAGVGTMLTCQKKTSWKDVCGQTPESCSDTACWICTTSETVDHEMMLTMVELFAECIGTDQQTLEYSQLSPPESSTTRIFVRSSFPFTTAQAIDQHAQGAGGSAWDQLTATEMKALRRLHRKGSQQRRGKPQADNQHEVKEPQKSNDPANQKRRQFRRFVAKGVLAVAQSAQRLQVAL